MADPKKGKKDSKKTKKKKVKKNVVNGKCHIYSSFNNTIITFTDMNGEAISWSSAGAKGFKGSRKNTPFAAQIAAADAAQKAADSGMKSVSCYVNGPGQGREPSVRAISNAGIRVNMIADITPVPHNGCRPPKRRRV